MYFPIVSTLLFVSAVFGEDLMNMPMPSFGGGGSTLPPPFGISGQFPPQNGMMMQPQSGYPAINPPPSFNGMNPPPQPFNGMPNNNMNPQPINSGPQMAQLAGFTNGFADMMEMSPSPMRGFPGNPPDQFNAIESVTSAPVIVKKRQAYPPNNGMNGQSGSNFGQSGMMGQQQTGFNGQPGINGQPNAMGGGMGMGQMNGGSQQPLGPAGIPIVGNAQNNFQNPSQQPFGSFPSGGLGGNSMPQQQQQHPGGMNSIQG